MRFRYITFLWYIRFWFKLHLIFHIIYILSDSVISLSNVWLYLILLINFLENCCSLFHYIKFSYIKIPLSCSKTELQSNFWPTTVHTKLRKKSSIYISDNVTLFLQPKIVTLTSITRRGAASTQHYGDTDLHPLLLMLHYFSILTLVLHPSVKI